MDNKRVITSQQNLFDTLAQVGKAQGSGHRLALLERIAQGELRRNPPTCVGKCFSASSIFTQDRAG